VRVRRRFALITVVLVAAGAVGCGNGRETADARIAGEDGIAWQRELIAAGPVGQAEYEAAVDRLKSCVAAEKVELSTEGWDPVHRMKMFLFYRAVDPGLSDDDVTRVMDTCRAASLDDVEQAYQRNRNPSMAPDLHAALQRCLQPLGVPPSRVTDDPVQVDRDVPSEKTWPCVQSAMAELYPEVTTVHFP
jgi:hypothetical protein